MARNAGTVASGSTITKSEPSASRMYSDKLTRMELGTDCGESQTQRIKPRTALIYAEDKLRSRLAVLRRGRNSWGHVFEFFAHTVRQPRDMTNHGRHFAFVILNEVQLHTNNRQREEKISF